jgi:hypothetical protein
VNLLFPSPGFDDVVAAVCHGLARDEQMRGLNELLRANLTAHDEYLLRVEIHSRLASEPDLFASAAAEVADTSSVGVAGHGAQNVLSLPSPATSQPWSGVGCGVGGLLHADRGWISPMAQASRRQGNHQHRSRRAGPCRGCAVEPGR